MRSPLWQWTRAWTTAWESYFPINLQVYTIVTTAVDGSSPQGRTAVVELLEKLQEPVQYLQELFQPVSSRVSQVRLQQRCRQ